MNNDETEPALGSPIYFSSFSLLFLIFYHCTIFVAFRCTTEKITVGHDDHPIEFLGSSYLMLYHSGCFWCLLIGWLWCSWCCGCCCVVPSWCCCDCLFHSLPNVDVEVNHNSFVYYSHLFFTPLFPPCSVYDDGLCSTCQNRVIGIYIWSDSYISLLSDVNHNPLRELLFHLANAFV